jgi:hypothetical protein
MVQWVRSLEHPFFLRYEVAESLGITLSMLSYLAKTYPEDNLGATHRASYEDVEILLYTPDRVEHIRQFLTTRREGGLRGRQRMFTASELQHRRRLAGRVRDYRKRGKEYAEAGKVEKSVRLLDMAVAVEAELDEGKARRVAELAKGSEA